MKQASVYSRGFRALAMSNGTRPCRIVAVQLTPKALTLPANCTGSPLLPDEAVKKYRCRPVLAIFGGTPPLPAYAIASCRPSYEVDFSYHCSSSWLRRFFLQPQRPRQAVPKASALGELLNPPLVPPSVIATTKNLDQSRQPLQPPPRKEFPCRAAFRTQKLRQSRSL